MFTTSCKKKDVPPTVPTLSTTAVTEVNTNTNTAKSGGTINGDGGAEITITGVCYSKTAQTPTISNDKIESEVTAGSFIVELTNIDPGSTYYVRAYATNSAGTGYGDVVTFTTGNGAPKANDVAITGITKVLEKLTAGYTYFDFENDPESGSTYQWYRANDAQGSGEVAISGSTTSTYDLLAADEFKYLRVGVVARSSAGTMVGVETKSAFVGPIAAPATTVNFTYDGKSVTYGILVSSGTGRRWLDRNLGAPNTPTAYNDFANYGDLFQWGRLADGHQKVIRGGTEIATGTATTSTLATSDIPGHATFILGSASSPYDWRNPSNSNLWQGVNGVNNPCPTGWRLPTSAEWDAENISSVETGYAQLKITFGGQRSGESGVINSLFSGDYWTSNYGAIYNEIRVFENGFSYLSGSPRSAGKSVRCIKD